MINRKFHIEKVETTKQVDKYLVNEAKKKTNFKHHTTFPDIHTGFLITVSYDVGEGDSHND